MSRFPPIAETNAPDKVAQTYSRLKEALGGESLPEVVLAFGQVEPFLRDFYMNFKKFVISDGALDAKSKAAIAYGAACHAKCGPWLDVLGDRARAAGYSDDQLAEIAAIVATNSMYNSFFKFRDLSGSDLFGGMPVGLRAHTFAGTSLDEKLVELINTAISNLNSCKPCTSGHVTAARQHGITDDQLLETIQCAATIAAACQFTSVAKS